MEWWDIISQREDQLKALDDLDPTARHYPEPLHFENADVTIERQRWRVRITIRLPGVETPAVLIAESSKPWYEADGQWFGTEKVWEYWLDDGG